MSKKCVAHALAIIIAASGMAVAHAGVRHYQYDENGNLVHGSVELDADGNIVDGTGLHFTYNDSNKLVRVNLHDANGPVLEEYAYDYKGQRFIKISNLYECEDGSNCESEEYDYQGNRTPIEKKLGKVTYYISKHYEESYDGKERIENGEKLAAESGQTNHIFAQGQRVAKRSKKLSVPLVAGSTMAQTSTENDYFFLNNHLGSTDIVLNAAAETLASMDYYPYGELRQPSEEAYSYTGKEKDFNTNQFYYEARYYDAGIRQFTQADTIVPEIYDPQSLNRYAYVRNNPIKYVDPSGHLYIPIYSELKDIDDAHEGALEAQNRANRIFASASKEQRGTIAPMVSDTHTYAQNGIASSQRTLVRTEGGTQVVVGAGSVAFGILTKNPDAIAQGLFDSSIGVSKLTSPDNIGNIDSYGSDYLQLPANILRNNGYSDAARVSALAGGIGRAGLLGRDLKGASSRLIGSKTLINEVPSFSRGLSLKPEVIGYAIDRSEATLSGLEFIQATMGSWGLVRE